MKSKSLTRGSYGEINMNQLNERTRKQIKNLVSGAANAQKVDEHGNWDFGAEFDSKGRGSALNWDLYGYGRDYHNRRMLIVIQVRQWSKTSRRGFANIRKSYFLIGRNEDNTIFAHPVESRVVQYAAKNDLDVVKRVQSWIFGADYESVIRHGDVALVPMSRTPNGEDLELHRIDLQPEDGSASHAIVADAFRQNGSLYALNPHLHHLPGTHPDVDGNGWCKVMIGTRAAFYDFAAPTID